jgi:hypothetical protein
VSPMPVYRCEAHVFADREGLVRWLVERQTKPGGWGIPETVIREFTADLDPGNVTNEVGYQGPRWMGMHVRTEELRRAGLVPRHHCLLSVALSPAQVVERNQAAAAGPSTDPDAEESRQCQPQKRQRLVASRGRRFIGSNGLIAKFERSGDPLLELQFLAALVAGPGLTPQQVIQRLVMSAELGAFPVPGTGFREYGDRRAVRDLLDLHSFVHPVAQPTSGQYALRPSLLTIQTTPGAMCARRSVWVRWLTALGWPVPPELRQPDTLAADYDEPTAEHGTVVDVDDADDGGEIAGPPPTKAEEFMRTAEARAWLAPGRPLLKKVETIAACCTELGVTRKVARAAFESALPLGRQRTRGGQRK